MKDIVAETLIKLPQKCRIVVVIFGAVLIHLSLGTYHTFGNMLPYMASYMRNYTDPSIQIEQLLWIPTMQGCFPFAMVVGGFISQKLGPRLAAMLGCYMMSLGVFLSSFTIKHSYWSFMFTYGLMFGLGQGMAYVIAVSVVINWAPQMVGFGSGIVAAGFGISSSIFAPIQTRMINWENSPPTKDGYFLDKDLLERVPGVFFDLSIIYFIMQTIGLIFICDPPSEYKKSFLEASLIDMEWLSRRRTDWMHNLISGVGRSNYSHNSSIAYSKYDYVKLPAFRESSVAKKNKILSKPKPNEDDDQNTLIKNQTNNNDIFDESDSDSVGSPEEQLARDSGNMDGGREIGRPMSSLTPEQMLKSSTFYFLFSALFCCSFYGNMFYNFGIVLALGSQYFLKDLGYTLAFLITAVFPFIALLLTAAIKVTPHGHLIM